MEDRDVDRTHARADNKGSINLRIEAQARRLIDEATALLGKARTEFTIDSARGRRAAG